MARGALCAPGWGLSPRWLCVLQGQVPPTVSVWPVLTEHRPETVLQRLSDGQRAAGGGGGQARGRGWCQELPGHLSVRWQVDSVLAVRTGAFLGEDRDSRLKMKLVHQGLCCCPRPWQTEAPYELGPARGPHGHLVVLHVTAGLWEPQPGGGTPTAQALALGGCSPGAALTPACASSVAGVPDPPPHCSCPARGGRCQDHRAAAPRCHGRRCQSS